MSKRRRTSVFAQARQVVTLPALVLVGYVNLGDELVYEYQGRKFTANIAAGGLLVASTRVNDGKSARQHTPDHRLPIYDNPTKWTEDCIAHYNRATGKIVRTRASPYSRITVSQANGESLQELRNRYMKEHVNMSPIQTPDAVRTAVQQRLERLGPMVKTDDASSSSSTETPSTLVLSSSLGVPRQDPMLRLGEPISVQRIRDGLDTNSYRDISYLLERRHNRVCRMLNELRGRVGRAGTAVATLKAALDKAADKGFDVATSLDDDASWHEGLMTWTRSEDSSTRVLTPKDAPASPQPKLARKRSRVLAPMMPRAMPSADIVMGPVGSHSVFSSAVISKGTQK